jgi:hypothetical protein
VELEVDDCVRRDPLDELAVDEAERAAERGMAIDETLEGAP